MFRFAISPLVLILALAGSSFAEPMCDCQKVTGSCQASLKLLSSSGEGKSYTAQYRITSTAASCSKVSYYIDGTPYFNVIANGNSAEDSTFGVKPITIKNFSGVQCVVCQQAGVSGSSDAREGVSSGSDSKINGVWRANYYVLTISGVPQNPRIDAVFDRGTRESYSEAATLSGNKLLFSWSMGAFGSNSCEFQLTGENTASAECKNFTGSRHIDYTRLQ